MNRTTKKAQAAIEYMLLLAVVVAIVLVGFRVYIPKTRVAVNQFYNETVEGVMGKPNPCGDGVCDPVLEWCAKCPPDCCPPP